MQPTDEPYEDADAPGAQVDTTITRLIITVEEPGSPPPIHTLRDGWLVSDSADIRLTELAELEAATRQWPASTGDGSWPPPVTLDELSERERQVVGYLPSVLSTAEIGAEMYVSANTVKLYLRSLYRKLGVNRRGDAVIQARRYGLL